MFRTYRSAVNAFICVVCALAGATHPFTLVVAGELQAVERVPQSRIAFPATRMAPDDAVLYCVPVLCPGKQAWVTVQNRNGKPLAGITVLVALEPHITDADGHAVFSVPNCEAMSISLLKSDNKALYRRQFSLVSGGYLAISGAAGTLKNILRGLPAQTAGPWLSYIPDVVQPGEVLAVVGENFETRPGAAQLFIGNVLNESLSGSAAALLVRAHPSLPTGAFAETFISNVHGESSNVLESDVAAVELKEITTGKNRGGESAASLTIVGTRAPVVVGLTVPGGSVPSPVLRMPNGEMVGDGSFVELPGGEHNEIAVTTNDAADRLSQLRFTVVPDAPALAGSDLLLSHAIQGLCQSVDRMRLIRIKQQLIGVEEMILDLRHQREDSLANLSVAEFESVSSRLRALSVRQQALNIAIAAKRAILSAAGENDRQIQQALDDAAGGGYFAAGRKLPDAETSPKAAAISGEAMVKMNEPVSGSSSATSSAFAPTPGAGAGSVYNANIDSGASSGPGPGAAPAPGAAPGATPAPGAQSGSVSEFVESMGNVSPFTPKEVMKTSESASLPSSPPVWRPAVIKGNPPSVVQVVQKEQALSGVASFTDGVKQSATLPANETPAPGLPASGREAIRSESIPARPFGYARLREPKMILLPPLEYAAGFEDKNTPVLFAAGNSALGVASSLTNRPAPSAPPPATQPLSLADKCNVLATASAYAPVPGVAVLPDASYERPPVERSERFEANGNGRSDQATLAGRTSGRTSSRIGLETQAARQVKEKQTVAASAKKAKLMSNGVAMTASHEKVWSGGKNKKDIKTKRQRQATSRTTAVKTKLAASSRQWKARHGQHGNKIDKSKGVVTKKRVAKRKRLPRLIHA